MSKEKEVSKQPPKGGPHGGPGHGPPGMMPGEKAKDFSGTMKKLVKLLSGYLPAIITALIMAAVSSVLILIGHRVLGNATDKIIEGFTAVIGRSGSFDMPAIGRILITAGIIYVTSSVLQYLLSFIFAGIANKFSYKLRNDISHKMNKLPLSYYDKHSHGDLLSRITNDVDTLNQTLNNSISSIVTNITSLIGAIVMMLTINVWMTLITILILPITGVLVKAIVKKTQPYFQKQQQYLGEVNGYVEEMYGGHMVVKAFGREEESQAEFDEKNQKLHKVAWKSQFFGSIMMPIMNFVSNIGYVLVCIAGGFFVLNGSITVGGIQAFIQYVRNFTQPITQLANSANTLQQTAAAAERIFEFLEEEEEIPDAENAVEIEGLESSVYFAHVNFGYVPEKTIIHDFSTIIEPGKQIAIVGPTGAGKTTIVKLLMRFYDVDDGAILVDGYNIKQFKRRDLRSMFGMVLQETWLYNGTIMENIRYGRLDATDEEVIEAAKAAQAHHFISTLPDGYNMVLNEEGTNISQGQKQLLTIARTILSDPKIIILDEATSSVDTRTEIAIQKAMGNLMTGRTTFIIAHRLSTIRDSDMIMVMRDGDIVETGKHQELIDKDGFYAKLYNSQFETGELEAEVSV